MGQILYPGAMGLGSKKYLNLIPAPQPASGNQVIFQMTVAGTDSTGPYSAPPNSTISGFVGDTPPTGPHPIGALNASPVNVNGAPIEVLASVGIGPIWYYNICLLGTFPQNHFNTMTFETVSDGPFVFSSAAADFNTLFTEPGYSIWSIEMPGTGFPSGFFATDSDITITW